MAAHLHLTGQTPRGNGHSLAPPARNDRVRGGYLGRGLPAWERADLAARHYQQGRPLERPNLQTLAVAYRVPVARVQRVRKGKPAAPPPPPSIVDLIATATPAELVSAAKALGVDRVWDSMVLPLVGHAAE